MAGEYLLSSSSKGVSGFDFGFHLPKLRYVCTPLGPYVPEWRVPNIKYVEHISLHC
jgi:hypothetical protein